LVAADISIMSSFPPFNDLTLLLSIQFGVCSLGQYQLMMRELALFEHSMSRGRSVHNAALREIDNHQSATKSVGNVIAHSPLSLLTDNC
jgi:hypothetical protein